MSRLNEYSPTYKPFTYPNLMRRAVDHEKIHWIEDEVDLGEDVEQWRNGTMTPEDINMVTQILRVFTEGDKNVAGNYADFFIPYFKNNEARCWLLSIAAREGTHQRAYALLTDTLGLPDTEYRAFLDYEEMADRLEFMSANDMSTPEGVGLALAKTVCNEGVLLFASFASLLNYQRFGKMKGMCKINEWSLREESQHVEGMAEMFIIHCKENPHIVTDDFKKKVYDVFREAVKAEDRFLDLVFEMGGPQGLTKEEVKRYIRYIADRRLVQLGFKPNWQIEENPLPWLAWVLNEGHTNFFEQRVSEYSVAGLEGEWGW